MKRFVWTAGLFMALPGAGCNEAGSTSISYFENPKTISIASTYKPAKFNEVQAYLEAHIGSQTTVSFARTHMDEMITMDDATRLHIKSSPGELNMELDKTDNARESYPQMKQWCEDLKRIVQGQHRSLTDDE
jgi:phosphoketolase